MALELSCLDMELLLSFSTPVDTKEALLNNNTNAQSLLLEKSPTQRTDVSASGGDTNIIKNQHCQIAIKDLQNTIINPIIITSPIKITQAIINSSEMNVYLFGLYRYSLKNLVYV